MTDPLILRLEGAILGAVEITGRLRMLLAGSPEGTLVALDAVRRHLEAAATETAALRRGLSGPR